MINQIREVAQQVLPKGAHVWLYGSRARGEARPDSDWDLLILVNKDKIGQDDFNNISYPFICRGWDLNEMIQPVMYTEKDWKKYSFTPFYKNVEHDKQLIYGTE